MIDRTYVPPSVRTESGGGGWETNKGNGGESRECSFEARMGEFSWRETFVQPAFPQTLVTFEKEFLLLVTRNGIKSRKEHERRGDEI